MAFRGEDQDYRWSEPNQSRPGRDRDVATGSLSLQDTLRELAVTILGFVAVIVVIMAVVSYFHS